MFNTIFSKKNKALLAELVRTDFKLRYQGSVLGYAWSLLKPLLMFTILYIVFVRFLRIGGDIENYPIILLFGIVVWSFFTEMTGQSLGAIVGRGDLIRKIRIPRWIIIVSTSISALINLFINLTIVAIFMYLARVDIRLDVLWLPVIFLQIYLLALGLSLLLSAAFVKFRDLSHVWDVITQAGFYITPILYPLSFIENVTFQKILLMNPMAQAIQDARWSLISADVLTVTSVFGNAAYRIIPLSLVIILLISGVLYFKKEAKHFAENL